MQPLFVVLYYSSEVPVFLYCSQVKARRRQQRCMAENRPQRCLDFYLRAVLRIAGLNKNQNVSLFLFGYWGEHTIKPGMPPPQTYIAV